MERARVEKALNRMSEYMDYVYDYPEAGQGLIDSLFDGKYREAYIKAYMDADPERLDLSSRIWFIEDEDEFQKAYSELKEQCRYVQDINSKLFKYMEELDDWYD